MKIIIVSAIMGVLIGNGLGLRSPLQAAEVSDQSAQLESVQAQLSTTRSPDEFCIDSNARLTIQRQGVIRFNDTLASGRADDEFGFCLIQNLSVQNLDADTEPEVIVDVFTGGAHCCTISHIYSYNSSTQTYQKIEQFWGNVGYELEDLDQDGIPEFRSADDRFSYAFSSYAASQRPLQIWRYQAGLMVDTTRQFSPLIYSHATRLWQWYATDRGQYQELDRALLAAYLADKHLLNQEEDGWQRVRQAYQWDDREVFFQDLADFLQDTGYAPGLTVERVIFPPQTIGLTLQGDVSATERRLYLLEAQMGQLLILELERGDVQVELISPWGETLERLTVPLTGRRVALTETGEYRVEVRANQPSRYQLMFQVR